MSKAIQDNDLLYNALSPLVQFGCRCHYNSFTVRGKENLPKDGAYIIAPCHQQALMEPLAVLCFAPKPPVFLARADIFKKPVFRTILTFLKIMPVYRIRDGKDQLGQNQEIFDRCRDVLLDGFPLCLMAEGRHNNRHHLLPMGKGMFRIAGETQLALGDYPLYIVPTGIDFDDYERPYSNLVVNIGKPIPVQPFMEKYREDEPVALNEMRDALREALSPLMHDVRDEEHYDEIMALCKSLNPEYRRREGLRNTAWNRFLMRQKITADYEKGVKGTGYGSKAKPAPWRPLLGVLCRSGFCTGGALDTAVLPGVLSPTLHTNAFDYEEEGCGPTVPQLGELRRAVPAVDSLCHCDRHRDGHLRWSVDGQCGSPRWLVGLGGSGLGANSCTPDSSGSQPAEIFFHA